MRLAARGVPTKALHYPILWQQGPAFPLAWIGGQGTVPYEQNTQQSPLLGLSSVWQLEHS